MTKTNPKTTKTTKITEFADFLKGKDNFLLFCHASPDGDTLGSAFALSYALKSLGKSVTVFCPDEVPERLSFLKICGEDVVRQIPIGDYTFFSVDIASPAMLKGVDKDIVFDCSVDHHRINTISSKLLLLDKESPAAGEIVYRIIKALGIRADKNIAFWLYTAISSDSGCFKYSSTRPSTMRIAAKLMETGIDFAKLNRLIFESKNPCQAMLEKTAYENMEMYFEGKVAVVCIPYSVYSQVKDEDIDVVYQIPRQIRGVEVSAVFTDKGNEIKASLRSNDYYDVAKLASCFNGGGHIHAAGCRFYNGLENAKNSVLQALSGDFE